MSNIIEKSLKKKKKKKKNVPQIYLTTLRTKQPKLYIK